MPQYELMYILSSDIPDNEEPALSDSIKNFIMETGGEITKEEKLGKKRLAYPIKKTRNAFYGLFHFNIASDKIIEIEHKIRVTQGIIRHMIVNMEDMLARMEKDKEEQKMIKRSTRPNNKDEVKKTPTKKEFSPDKPEIKIDLDKQIEKALEQDITK